MPRKLGMQAKLYRNTGDYATPVWVELTNAKDVTLNLEKGEADVTTRGNNGWKATAATLKDMSVEFQMVYDTEDSSYSALEQAFFQDEIVEVAVADGVIATEGTKYIRAVDGSIQFQPKRAERRSHHGRCDAQAHVRGQRPGAGHHAGGLNPFSVGGDHTPRALYRTS